MEVRRVWSLCRMFTDTLSHGSDENREGTVRLHGIFLLPFISRSSTSASLKHTVRGRLRVAVPSCSIAATPFERLEAPKLISGFQPVKTVDSRERGVFAQFLGMTVVGLDNADIESGADEVQSAFLGRREVELHISTLPRVAVEPDASIGAVASRRPRPPDVQEQSGCHMSRCSRTTAPLRVSFPIATNSSRSATETLKATRRSRCATSAPTSARSIAYSSSLSAR